MNCPEVSYKHVLAELSVNRKDPCEIIRELISNSYDADAKSIYIYPLLQYKGLIFFDDGIGMSEKEGDQSISSYKAFFSIGRSTKVRGKSIGYKCQGSKLCFAAGKFSLITRCEGEHYWRFISIDNPKENLEKFDISSKQDEAPWKRIKELFLRPDERTTLIIDSLNEEFFLRNFSTGSMIIIEKMEVEHFGNFYGADGPNHSHSDKYEKDHNVKMEDWSYIKNYIKYKTKHGDIKILNYKRTGFPAQYENSVKSAPGYKEPCELYLWSKGEPKKIKPGFPYLEEPDEQAKNQIKSPANVARLTDGHFYYRAAKYFEFEGGKYSVILAVDGNRRARTEYHELDRQGKDGKRSGIKLSEIKGTFICCQGIKICLYDEIFEHSKLDKYAILAEPEAKAHYMLMVDGSFELVTDRNSLSDTSVKILKDDHFIDNIKAFFDRCAAENNVFKELLDRLKKQNSDINVHQVVDRFNNLKNSMMYRERFKVTNIPQLEDKYFFSPILGEENWVGALYTLFAYLVPSDSRFGNIWLLPRNFSGGNGVDTVAVDIDKSSLFGSNVHRGLEYKFIFDFKDPFNHLLTVTDQIVCWDMAIPGENCTEKVKDDYDYYGKIFVNPQLQGIGYEIVSIKNYDGTPHDGTVKVISLKKLLNETFDIEWEFPQPRESNFRQSGRSRRR